MYTIYTAHSVFSLHAVCFEYIFILYSVGCLCFILQYLPRNQHLVCVDMPGHEGTSRTGAEDYSIEGQVARIHQVCMSGDDNTL